MPKIDVVRRIDQESLSSVLGASSSQSGTGSTIFGLIGLKDQSSAAVYGDPYGFVQLIGADSSISVYRINSTQLGIQANISGLDHNTLGNLDVGDVHTQYASANGIGTRSAYQSERVNKSILTPSGSGLTGGGVLTSNRSISLVLAGSGGLEIATNSLQLADTVAGDGLDISVNKVLSVKPDRMLTIVNDYVGIGAGANHQFIGTTTGTAAGWKNVSTLAGTNMSYSAGTLLVNLAYNFDWTGTHSFDNDIQLDANLDFIGAQSITTSSDDLTIAPAGDLWINPAGNQTKWTWAAGKSLESSNYSSQSAGWGISYGTSGGHADFRSMYADSLHVLAFTADVYQALVGAIIISKSRGRLSRNFTIPAIGVAATLYLEDLEDLPELALFANGDYVRLRIIDSSGGGLIVGDTWGVVSTYNNLSGGEQSWQFTTAEDNGNAGKIIYKGSVALDYGTTGSYNGVWEATVLDQAGAPYSQVKTWAGNPYQPGNFTTHLRVGNLDGIGGVGAEWGMWVGQNTATDYLLLSDQHLEAHGLRVSLYYGGVERIRLDPSAPSIALGETLPTVFGADGIWMGRHSDGTYRLSFEEEDGYSYLRWTWDAGSDHMVLQLAGDLHLQNSPGAGGGTSLGPKLTIDTYGMVEMGTDSVFQMGEFSSFTAAEYSTFQIGEAPGDYLNFSNGVLTLKGKIVVTDGGDVDAIAYTPEAVSLWTNIPYYNGTHFFFFGGVPYCGFVEMVDGNIYNLIDDTGGVDTNVARANNRHVIFFIHKDGTGITNTQATPNRDYWGVANYDTFTLLGQDTEFAVDLLAMNQDLYYSTYNAAARANHVQVGHAYLNGDLSVIEYASGAGLSASTVIGPGYIVTDTLSAISADLGTITAGTISGITMTLTNDANTLWFNNGTNDIVLAAGSTAGGIAAAQFRVYEDGQWYAGGGSQFVRWNGSALTVKGTIQADAGQINGNLTVESAGNVRMNGGKIQWQNDNGTYRSYIDNTKIVISEASGYSITRIGDTGQDGLIDVDMFNTAQGVWKYGVHITDGGNSLPNESALFHGQTAIGEDAVDRIFNAYAADNGGSLNEADGFYAQIEGGTWNNFSSNGVAFKGQTDFSPAVVARRNETTGMAPAVWAQNMAATGATYSAVIGASNQTAFYVDNNTLGGTGIVALQANGGAVDRVYWLGLKEVGYDSDIPTPGAGYVNYYHSTTYGFSRKHSNGTVVRI